jgi:hypothetical protein
MTDLQKTIKMLDGGKALIEQAKSEEGLWIMGYKDYSMFSQSTQERTKERMPWLFDNHLYGVKIEGGYVKIVRLVEALNQGRRYLDYYCEMYKESDVVINAAEGVMTLKKVVDAIGMWIDFSNTKAFIEGASREEIEASGCSCETEKEFWASLPFNPNAIDIRKDAILITSGDGAL